MMWKGRLHFRQYTALKRAHFGIKLFCLAEDSGCLYRFLIYTGKQDHATTMASVMTPECAGFSHTEQVVVCTWLCRCLIRDIQASWITGIQLVVCTIILTTEKPQLVVRCCQTQLHCLCISQSRHLASQLHFDMDQCCVSSSRTRKTFTYSRHVTTKPR